MLFGRRFAFVVAFVLVLLGGMGVAVDLQELLDVRPGINLRRIQALMAKNGLDIADPGGIVEH